MMNDRNTVIIFFLTLQIVLDGRVIKIFVTRLTSFYWLNKINSVHCGPSFCIIPFSDKFRNL